MLPTDSILVVEDHRDTCEMLTDYLTFCGYIVHAAADGVEAIDLALRVHPRIILMDLMMPRMDGWEATRRLKADDRTRDIVVIAVSACSQSDEPQSIRQSGWDYFMPKPLDLTHVDDVLSDLLGA
jgi:CheY-like chemotaxis protein